VRKNSLPLNLNKIKLRRFPIAYLDQMSRDKYHWLPSLTMLTSRDKMWAAWLTNSSNSRSFTKTMKLIQFHLTPNKQGSNIKNRSLSKRRRSWSYWRSRSWRNDNRKSWKILHRAIVSARRSKKRLDLRRSHRLTNTTVDQNGSRSPTTWGSADILHYIYNTSRLGFSKSICHSILLLMTQRYVDFIDIEFLYELEVVFSLQHHRWFSLVAREVPYRSFVRYISENTRSLFPMALTMASL